MNVVKNGSFETARRRSRRLRHDPVDADAPALPDWTIDSGDIDLAEQHLLERRRTATSPSTSTGSDAGRDLADFPTVVGQNYDVTFRYSANPESSDPTPTMAVQVNGAAGRLAVQRTRRAGGVRSLTPSPGRTATSRSRRRQRRRR